MKVTSVRCLLLCALVLLTAGALSQQTSSPQLYRLFTAVSPETVESKLNEGAVAGYRLLAASPVHTAGTAVLMVTADSGNYEYRVVTGTAESKDFEKKLKAVGRHGYLLVPGGVFYVGSRRSSTQVTAILEKPPGALPLDYVVPRSVLFMGLAQKEFAKRQKQGYRALAAHHSGGLCIAIMVRRSDADKNIPSNQKFRYVTEKIPKLKDDSDLATFSKLDTKLDEQAQDGYRLIDFSVDSEDLASLLVEGDPTIKESHLLARRKWTDFEADLNRLGGEGFRLYPTLMFGLQIQGTWTVHLSPLIMGVAERHEGQLKYQYRIVGAKELPALLKELNKATDDGYKPVPMTLDVDVDPVTRELEFKMVVERVAPVAQEGAQ